MPEKTKSKSGDPSNVDPWEAISTFEKILQAFPNDYVALDALVHAYETVGDHTRALEYLLRLANLLIEQADVDSSVMLIEKIRQYEDIDPQVKAVIARIVALQTSEAEKQPLKVPELKPTSRGQEALKRTSPVADELSFAWHLLQTGLLTQEDYVAVAHDLTEVSAKEAALTVSVLHVLHDRGYRNLSAVMAFVAKDSNIPLLAISSFDLQAETAALLPLDFVIRRGALAFETIGPDVLVAVMNPYNQVLREDVKEILGRQCHFYLTSPADFDAAVNRIRTMSEEKKETPGKERKTGS
jgi:tetratricopeptide (TPR) repeat protein